MSNLHCFHCCLKACNAFMFISMKWPILHWIVGALEASSSNAESTSISRKVFESCFPIFAPHVLERHVMCSFPSSHPAPTSRVQGLDIFDQSNQHLAVAMVHISYGEKCRSLFGIVEACVVLFARWAAAFTGTSGAPGMIRNSGSSKAAEPSSFLLAFHNLCSHVQKTFSLQVVSARKCSSSTCKALA